MKNCGIIVVIHGEISESGLVAKMAETWNASWSWQVRKLEETSFVVRFPPSKQVSDLVGLPSINLTEGPDTDRVTIKILPWDGDLPDLGELTEVWVQLEGIPPRWCT